MNWYAWEYAFVYRSFKMDVAASSLVINGNTRSKNGVCLTINHLFAIY